jgi:hypothetical protein
VADLILGVKGMLLQQWLILFTTACFGNLLGLNISAGMRTAISIYILIPLILVPQLLLGGAMIKFDDLHKSLTRKIYVPVIGDIMATRWAYEAISVEEFRNNKFEKPFFRSEMEMSQDDWYSYFLIPLLKAKTDACRVNTLRPIEKQEAIDNLEEVKYHILDLSAISGIVPGKWTDNHDYLRFNNLTGDNAIIFLDSLKATFRGRYKLASANHDLVYNAMKGKMGEDKFFLLKENNLNESLQDLVLNRMTISKIYDTGKKIIQKADPVFMAPGSKYGRAHFFAPFKLLGILRISTLIFNMAAIWIMIAGLFVTLYYNVLKRFIMWLESLKLPITRKFGRDMLQL